MHSYLAKRRVYVLEDNLDREDVGISTAHEILLDTVLDAALGHGHLPCELERCLVELEDRVDTGHVCYITPCPAACRREEIVFACKTQVCGGRLADMRTYTIKMRVRSPAEYALRTNECVLHESGLGIPISLG